MTPNGRPKRKQASSGELRNTDYRQRERRHGDQWKHLQGLTISLKSCTNKHLWEHLNHKVIVNTTWSFKHWKRDERKEMSPKLWLYSFKIWPAEWRCSSCLWQQVVLMEQKKATLSFGNSHDILTGILRRDRCLKHVETTVTGRQTSLLVRPQYKHTCGTGHPLSCLQETSVCCDLSKAVW